MPISFKKISVAALLSCTICKVSLAEEHTWQAPNYILSSFYKIALQNEYGGGDAKLHKWQQPIRYEIIDRTSDQQLHSMLVQKHMHQLTAITHIDISPATKSEKTNLRILFSAEHDLNNDISSEYGIHNEQLRDELLRSSVCSAHFSTGQQGAITLATVIIPVDRARAHGKLLSCIVEELTQVMGLPNDSVEVYPSIFNDRSHNQFLTGLDFILLKLLYAPAIKAGMSEQHLKSLLPNLISHSDFQALIRQADQAVREHNLSNLVDQ